jgi:hypothetical protein
MVTIGAVKCIQATISNLVAHEESTDFDKHMGMRKSLSGEYPFNEERMRRHVTNAEHEGDPADLSSTRHR